MGRRWEEGVYGEEMEGNEEEWSRFKEAILEGGGRNSVGREDVLLSQ